MKAINEAIKKHEKLINPPLKNLKTPQIPLYKKPPQVKQLPKLKKVTLFLLPTLAEMLP